MSPVSLLKHSVAQASPRSIQSFDSRNVRCYADWSRVLGITGKQLASAIAAVGEGNADVRLVLPSATARPRLVRVAADVLRTIRDRLV